MQGFHGAVDDHLAYLVDLGDLPRKGGNTEENSPKSLIHDEIPILKKNTTNSELFIWSFLMSYTYIPKEQKILNI